MDPVKIGRLILFLRKEKGLTQKQLANMMHVSDKTVSKQSANPRDGSRGMEPVDSSIVKRKRMCYDKGEISKKGTKHGQFRKKME